MPSKRDEAKRELIERAAEIAAQDDGRGPERSPLGLSAGDFLRLYYRRVAAEDLLGRDPGEIAGSALAHRELARDRPQGVARVVVFNPDVDSHGWAAGHTIVQIVTDDMPFLVDSVSNAIGLSVPGIHLIVHPTLEVCRSLTGELWQILDTEINEEGAAVTEPVTRESWIHVEIDRIGDTECAALESTLRRVLGDVREAVEDWPKMRQAALRIADNLATAPPPGVSEVEVSEGWELLRWLADNHFTFLGFREYELRRVDGEDALVAVPGSGLGILRADQQVSKSFGTLPPEQRARARDPHILVLTQANTRSTIHRASYLDYVGVKTFDAEGRVAGERRFLGLYTSTAYTQSVLRVPVLRRKVREIQEQAGFTADSHDGKNLLELLESYPRAELFQISVDDLLPIVLSVLALQERRQTRLFLRRDIYGRFMSCLVYLPRDRYTTPVRLEIARILQEAFAGSTVDYTARVTESVLARLHFVVRVEPGADLPEVDPDQLEARLVAATRSWTDDFLDALREGVGEQQAIRLGRRWADAFPEGYKADFTPAEALSDVLAVEALGGELQMALDLYEPPGAGVGERRFKIFTLGAALSLSEILPVLQRMGVEVTDERPYVFERSGGEVAHVYDFGLRYDPGRSALTRAGSGPVTSPLGAPVDLRELFEDAFRAVWNARAESDGLNALVTLAGLDWRQVTVLRAYTKYLRQTGSTFSQDYVEQCLQANLGVTRALVRLFEVRLDPKYRGDREATAEQVVAGIQADLDEVTSLDQDRILRSFLALVRATLRTNAFQRGRDRELHSYLSFKLDPHALPDLPKPKPRFEIWVYSPRVEGVHLRFGPVARGGLRWSDRREDFRTEVLGLVKAQMVKNAVIVPVGAKGGFCPKQLPDPGVDREAWLAEGVACYRTFVSALLDVTDNLVDGAVVPPPEVVRHDPDDPYLVVAADKGTATFSDIANGISGEYGPWLGDAFASGGSAGYDHKAMGITAKGAWESVKRHFVELGVDTQTQEFTVVGVGDMSGDVFGNGMLLSQHIRLVSAFDHRHVFIDPTPDPAASFAERQRLFALPRSSWDDYDKDLLSEGGGVWPRTAKSIPVSAQMREALGLDPEATAMTPAELVHAVLLAPVDLLWNGGIGTYVKAATETHAQAGDKANDAVRVDGRELRVRVVGEGGNLGLTQLGRIEAARRGVRLNTDAIDNSAGVDTSDHEVNIKILLDRIVRRGDLTPKGRNEFLAEMTDDVAHHVLRDNYEQNVLLGNARAQAPALLTVHQRLIRDLERRGLLDRALEFLPSDAEIDALYSAGEGLSSPELSVLVAYAKLTLDEDLMATGLPDEPWCQALLSAYFPPLLVQRYSDQLEGHRLRREIVINVLVNAMINRGGISFAFRACEETGATPAEVARAYAVVREVFGLQHLWDRIESLDALVPTTAQIALSLECRRLLDRATRWLLQERRAAVDVLAEIEHFAPVARLTAVVPKFLRGVEHERFDRRTADFVNAGAPMDLSAEVAGLLDAFSLLDICEIASSSGEDPESVGELYFALSERFEVDRMLNRITQLPREDRWSALARMSLRYDLYAALALLTRSAQRASAGTVGPDERIEAWEALNAEGLARARATLNEIATSDSSDLASLSVALRVIRTLVSGGVGAR
jgi:glutamate dehydrogenase